jgi:formylmethanofuran dehydrogenase subunit E-like metal-binding protein
MTINQKILDFKKDQRVEWRDREGAAPWAGTIEHVSLDYVEVQLDTQPGRGDVFVMALPDELEIIE